MTTNPFAKKIQHPTVICFQFREENLINKNNNAEFYYLRLADEILRNDRIRQFIMEPDQVLFLTSVPYELNENEIIILNSLLTQEYFLNKRPYKKNKYVKHDAFNTIEPALSEPYSSKIDIVEQSKITRYISNCFEGHENIKGKGKESWKMLFGPEFFALKPHTTPNCTIDLFIMALHEKGLKNDIDTESLKKVLISEYNRLFEAGHKEQIMKILANEGKKTIVKSIESGKSNFIEYIISVTYYFTLLDYWILANYYKLNIVFLTSTELVENKSNALVTSTDYTKKFLIIKLPGTKENIVPEYKIYTDKPKEPALLSHIPRDAENYIQKIPYLGLEEMITKFKPKKYVKKKKLLIQND
jgi:predicted SnoaL-like aldol condensation-catalyzing enzyme